MDRRIAIATAFAAVMLLMVSVQASSAYTFDGDTFDTNSESWYGYIKNATYLAGLGYDPWVTPDLTIGRDLNSSGYAARALNLTKDFGFTESYFSEGTYLLNLSIVSRFYQTSTNVTLAVLVGNTVVWSYTDTSGDGWAMNRTDDVSVEVDFPLCGNVSVTLADYDATPADSNAGRLYVDNVTITIQDAYVAVNYTITLLNETTGSAADMSAMSYAIYEQFQNLTLSATTIYNNSFIYYTADEPNALGIYGISGSNSYLRYLYPNASGQSLTYYIPELTGTNPVASFLFYVVDSSSTYGPGSTLSAATIVDGSTVVVAQARTDGVNSALLALSYQKSHTLTLTSDNDTYTQAGVIPASSPIWISVSASGTATVVYVNVSGYEIWTVWELDPGDPVNWQKPNATDLGAMSYFGTFASYDWGHYALIFIPLLFIAIAGKHWMWIAGFVSAGFCMLINVASGLEVFSTTILGSIAFVCILMAIREGSA